MTVTSPNTVHVLLPGRRDHVAGKTRRARPVILSRNSLRIALAIIWLLDGALQLQAFMFSKGFARTIIAPAASGQPFFVAGPVEWNARIIASHPALLNALFASIQLLLGLGFLFWRTTRVAVVGSVVWVAGVWYLGEGLGGIAGGHVTALVGAPGAALLYAVLALAAWPGSARDRSDLLASDTTSPPRWVLTAWLILWIGFAILDLLPPNRSSRSISSLLAANASTVPSWLAAVDHAMASAALALGGGILVPTVALELAIGLLILWRGLPRAAALWVGIGVSGLYWAVGQNFGQLFSGQATDPSTGPLLILLGLAALGARRRQDVGSERRFPQHYAWRHPYLSLGGDRVA